MKKHPNGGPTSSTNNLVCAQVSTYYCPSDRGAPAFWKGDPYYRARGNYVANYGPLLLFTDPAAGDPRVGPFGWTFSGGFGAGNGVGFHRRRSRRD